jgi:hypothetical protein
MAPRPPRSESPGELITGVKWSDYLRWIKEVWLPGQHMALIGPTGEGKTTYAGGVLQARKYVLSLDAKGNDSTLSATGFRRVVEWPPPKDVLQDLAEGRPARLIVGFELRTVADFDRLKRLLSKVLDSSYAEQGWTIHCDELQLLADRKMMNLGPKVEKHLVSARDKKISIVTSYQAPSWVPWAASRQARWIVIWPNRDTNMIAKLAEATGRPKDLLLEAVQNLPQFHCLTVPPNFRDPMVLTNPRRLN